MDVYLHPSKYLRQAENSGIYSLRVREATSLQRNPPGLECLTTTTFRQPSYVVIQGECREEKISNTIVLVGLVLLTVMVSELLATIITTQLRLMEIATAEKRVFQAFLKKNKLTEEQVG